MGVYERKKESDGNEHFLGKTRKKMCNLTKEKEWKIEAML